MTWVKIDKVKGTLPIPRFGHTATVVGSKMYVIGGSSEEPTDLCEVYVLDLEKLTWTKARSYEGTPPSRRWYHTACLIDDQKILIFGGCNSERGFNDVYTLSIGNDKMRWENVGTEGDIPAARYGHTASMFGNKMYIVGGWDMEDEGCARYIHALDVDEMEWSMEEQEDDRLSLSRQFHSAAMLDGRIYVYGGADCNDGDEESLDDFFYISLGNMERHSLMDGVVGESPRERMRHSCVVASEHLIFYGGSAEEDDKRYNSDVYIFNSQTLEWKCCVVSDEPPGREAHSIVVWGDRLVLFGGNCEGDEDTNFNDLYMLDLGTLGIYQIPESEIVSDFSKLLNQKEFSDFTVFTSDDTPIYTHKAILFSRCKHFADMYRSGAMETQSNSVKINEPHDTVYALLSYLYADKLHPSPDIVADLLLLADMYLLDRLKKLCFQSLHKNLKIDNAAKIFHRAAMIKADSLKSYCLRFIADNYGAVTKTKDFRALATEPNIFEELFESIPHDWKLTGSKKRKR